MTYTLYVPASQEKSQDPLSMYKGDICTVNVNMAGLPAVVLPCGFAEQVCVCVRARAWQCFYLLCLLTLCIPSLLPLLRWQDLPSLFDPSCMHSLSFLPYLSPLSFGVFAGQN